MIFQVMMKITVLILKLHSLKKNEYVLKNDFVNLWWHFVDKFSKKLIYMENK